MVYKYSISIILRSGYIDTTNSFLDEDKSYFENFIKVLSFDQDNILLNLIVDFESDKNNQAGVWLDYSEYNLPEKVEKIYITKVLT